MRNYIQKAVAYIISKANNNSIIAEYHKRSSGKAIDYSRQATTMSKKEIKDWINGVMAATDPLNPKRGELMRFYENMKIDGHLMSCVENRTLPVQCAPYKLVDRNGDEDLEAKKLLERPWFLELVRLINNHTFEGTKLIELFDINENGELKEIREIPQSNFIAQKGIVIKEEWDDVGTSYREGVYKNYYIQIGSDWNLGLFSQLAMVVIAKKLGLGSWMSYIDKFGVPPIFAITERMDPQRRDELFEMLENFRMNHFAVLQGNERIETPQGYNVDAYQTFKSLMNDICDKEISKRVLGSSGLTEEKSFVGAAEAQERLLAFRHNVDKLFFKFYFNEEIKPRLVKLSPIYSVLENLTFEYDESESLSMIDYIDKINNLSAYYEFDIKELVKVTGLPFTKVKEQFPNYGQEEETEKKKTSARALTTRNKHNFAIYAATWEKANRDIMEKLRNAEVDPADLNEDFVLKTYAKLSKSAELGYGDTFYEDKIARKLRENLLQFASTKTYILQKEIKDYSNKVADELAYKEEVERYLEKQNGNYLDTQSSFFSEIWTGCQTMGRVSKGQRHLSESEI